MIKHILFDMGGVIFNQNTEEAFRRFEAMGIDTAHYMGRYGQKDFFLDLETGTINAEEFCKKMADTTNRKEITWEEAQQCWLGFVDGISQKRLQHLQTLRKSYRLSLLSNTNPFVMAYMRSNLFSEQGLSIEHFFDTFFCSYEMKVCKPHAEIYQQVLRTLQAKGEECIFVDDSKANTEAAEALGFHTLHIETNADWMPALQEKLDKLNKR